MIIFTLNVVHVTLTLNFSKFYYVNEITGSKNSRVFAKSKTPSRHLVTHFLRRLKNSTSIVGVAAQHGGRVHSRCQGKQENRSPAASDFAARFVYRRVCFCISSNILWNEPSIDSIGQQHRRYISRSWRPSRAHPNPIWLPSRSSHRLKTLCPALKRPLSLSLSLVRSTSLQTRGHNAESHRLCTDPSSRAQYAAVTALTTPCLLFLPSLSLLLFFLRGEPCVSY